MSRADSEPDPGQDGEDRDAAAEDRRSTAVLLNRKPEEPELRWVVHYLVRWRGHTVSCGP